MKKNTAERILSGLLAMIIVLTCGVVRAKADNDEISEMKVITGKGSYEYDIVCAGKEAVVTERGTLQLALISKADGEPVTKGILWDSSKPDIAGISSTGLLTGKKTGTVTVSCLALDGRTVYAAADIRVAIGVSGITLDAESISLLTGVPGKNDTVAVTATVLPENAYFKGVTWHSENEDVAAVDAKGNIKAVSAGKTRMIAESEDPGYSHHHICNVEVCQAVTAIELASESLTVYTGESISTGANVCPEDAANKIIEWVSSDPEVASVDSLGNIKGISVGTTMVTGTATDGSGTSASCKVEVIAKVRDLKLNESSVTLYLGLNNGRQETVLGYELVPEDALIKTVSWSSSDEEVATVDEGGTVRAVSEGTAVITAVSDDESCSKTVSCKVTVLQALSKIALSTQNETLYTGTGMRIEAETYPENATNKKCIWESSDKSVATVDSGGNVRAVAVGSAVISCTAADGSGTCAKCSVDVIAKVKGLKISADKTTLLIGAGDRLRTDLDCSTVPDNAYYQGVFWSSSDENVATVDENGVVSAAGVGTAVISAVSEDPDYTKPAECRVTVEQAVMGISITGEKTEIFNGETLALETIITPENATNQKVEWKSSDPDVATVDSKGLVKGKTAGVASITCTALDGSDVSRNYDVTVNAKVTGIELQDAKMNLLLYSKAGQSSKQIKYAVEPENAHIRTVTWTSSDETVVTVGEDGTVKAVSPGKAVITAVSDDPSYTGKATCSIEVGYAVKSVEMSLDSTSMKKGAQQKATATVLPENALNRKLEWTSSDESVAKVDSNGTVTALQTGSATIRCCSTDGENISDEISIKVYQPITGITPSQSSYIVFVGDDKYISRTISPKDATNTQLSWESSSNCVSVGQDGRVTGVSRGSATVTCKAKDGSGTSASVTVYSEPKVPVSVDGVGTGVYLPNLLGITFSSRCSKAVITDIVFDMTIKTGFGFWNEDSGTYHTENIYLGPGQSIEFKRSAKDVYQADSIKITVVGVQLSDGTYYEIPRSARDKTTWNF